jgi:hypothetical protein
MVAIYIKKIVINNQTYEQSIFISIYIPLCSLFFSFSRRIIVDIYYLFYRKTKYISSLPFFICAIFSSLEKP